MSRLDVRSAEIGDVPRLAELFAQLGYPGAADDLADRLEILLADPRGDILVATAEGTLVGAATLYLVPVAHEKAPWCRLTALVVDEANRGRGVGQALVAAVEETARAAGCGRVEATSAAHRIEAHRFYQHLGYSQVAEHFLKSLPTELAEQATPVRHARS